MAGPVQRTIHVSVEQPVHQIDCIVLFLIDDFGVYLCHLHVGMTEQLRGGIEVGAKRQHHRRKRVTGGVEQNPQSSRLQTGNNKT